MLSNPFLSVSCMTTSPTISSITRSASRLEKEMWESPVRHMVARVMWGDEEVE